jgi:hypothetical protein
MSPPTIVVLDTPASRLGRVIALLDGAGTLGHVNLLVRSAVLPDVHSSRELSILILPTIRKGQHRFQVDGLG